MLLANDRKLDRPVALKLVGAGPQAAADDDRFNREIRLTARLVHPNIVPLFDSGRAGDQLFYVMPFIDGETLRDRLNRLGPRPESEVERVLQDLAEALAYAHASGVVHRDVKPENIFWYGGRALLADFGIASVMHGTASHTAARGTQGILGTANYMSPEQVGGDDLDGRSDLYSLGCVAFELLVTTPPFARDSFVATLAAHVTGDAPPLAKVRPETSATLAATIDRLLARSRDQRPATAAVLLDLLSPSPAEPSPWHSPGPTVPSSSPQSNTPVPSPVTARPHSEAEQLCAAGHALFVRSRHGVEGGARNGLEMARVYFEQALQKDPNCAAACAGLADLLHMMGNRGFLPKPESRAEARALRLKALAMDDSSGEVHMSLGFTFLYFEDDFETAGIEIRRGVALLPDDGEAHRVYGAWLKIAGRLEEAREQMLVAVALNPQAPVSHTGLSDVLMALGRNAEAVTLLGTALRLSPTYQAALERLDMCCHRAGWHDQALDARRTLLGMRGLHERAAALQETTRTDGWPVARERDVHNELDALLGRAAQEDPFIELGTRMQADSIVIAHAELGEWSGAMDWVERGYYQRPGRLRRVLTDLPYDRRGLASDPRYVRLLRTAGLAELI